MRRERTHAHALALAERDGCPRAQNGRAHAREEYNNFVEMTETHEHAFVHSQWVCCHAVWGYIQRQRPCTHNMPLSNTRSSHGTTTGEEQLKLGEHWRVRTRCVCENPRASRDVLFRDFRELRFSLCPPRSVPFVPTDAGARLQYILLSACTRSRRRRRRHRDRFVRERYASRQELRRYACIGKTSAQNAHARVQLARTDHLFIWPCCGGGGETNIDVCGEH